MWNKTNLKAFALALVTSLYTAGTSATSIDGSHNLLCAALDVVGCENGPGCVEGQARDFELPQFMLIDFENKLIRAKDDVEKKVVSPMQNIQKTNKQIIIQGVENDHGWSATINRESGDINFAASGPEVSFMVFAACTTLK